MINSVFVISPVGLMKMSLMSGLNFFIKSVLLTLLLVSATALVAQQSANPFELQHRIKDDPLQDTSSLNSGNPFDIEARQSPLELDETTAVNVKTEVASSNPFDIQKAKIPQDKTAKKNKNFEFKLPKKKIKKPEDTRSGFLFWSILGVMIFLALMVTLYRGLIGKVYRAFSNENVLKLLQREQSGVVSMPYLFLYALFFVNAGIFLFQLGYFNEVLSFEWQTMLYVVLGVTMFFMLKHLMLSFIGWVFPINKEVRQYSFTIVIFSIMLGLFLIPFNAFIAFAPESMTKIGFILALISVTIVYLFRGLRGLLIGSKYLAFSKFHFFMYLCIVEMAPLLIVIRLLLNGAN